MASASSVASDAVVVASTSVNSTCAAVSPKKWPPSRCFEWEFVEYRNPERRAGCWEVKCRFCTKEFRVGSVARVREHFVGGGRKNIDVCPSIPVATLEKFQSLTRSNQERRGIKRQLETSVIQETPQQSNILSKSAPQLGFPCPEDVDNAVAEFFYGCGVSFNCARSPYFKNMVSAIARYCSAYVLPKYEKLRTTLLSDVKSRLENELQPVRSSWATTGCTIMSDGWSSTTRRPLLNVLAVAPAGDIFLRAIDTSGSEKTGDYIAQSLIHAIEDVGPRQVVQVVTDHALNCKKAGKLIEEKFPHIVWSGCAAHALDLALEDIGRLSWVSTIVKEAKNTTKFITSHHMSLALFRLFSSFERGLELLRPGDTRFGTNFIMLERRLEVKGPLQRLVVSTEWQSWTYVDRKEVVESFCAVTNPMWKAVAQVVEVTKPIFVLLRLVDSGVPTRGKLYGKMMQLVQDISSMQNLDPEAKIEVLHILQHRWELNLNSPFHCARFVLDPQWHGQGQANNSAIMQGFRIVRNRFFLDVKDQADVERELALYRNLKGMFADPASRINANNMPGHTWWESYGGDTPKLQSLAIKVLSQVTVASACERNWSSFDFIHSKRRNRLTPSRASDLVFVFSTLRLKQKFFDPEYKEEVADCGVEEDDLLE